VVLAPRQRTRAVVAVCWKIAYYPIKAVKFSKNKLEYAVFWHSEALLYDCIVFHFTFKGTGQQNILTVCKSRKLVFHWEPIWKIVVFKQAILTTVAELTISTKINFVGISIGILSILISILTGLTYFSEKCFEKFTLVLKSGTEIEIVMSKLEFRFLIEIRIGIPMSKSKLKSKFWFQCWIWHGNSDFDSKILTKSE
jgi:hypothetical protein